MVARVVKGDLDGTIDRAVIQEDLDGTTDRAVIQAGSDGTIDRADTAKTPAMAQTGAAVDMAVPEIRTMAHREEEASGMEEPGVKVALAAATIRLVRTSGRGKEEQKLILSARDCFLISRRFLPSCICEHGYGVGWAN